MKDYVDQYDTENDDADIDVNLSVKFDNLVVFLFTSALLLSLTILSFFPGKTMLPWHT